MQQKAQEARLRECHLRTECEGTARTFSLPKMLVVTFLTSFRPNRAEVGGYPVVQAAMLRCKPGHSKRPRVYSLL